MTDEFPTNISDDASKRVLAEGLEDTVKGLYKITTRHGERFRINVMPNGNFQPGFGWITPKGTLIVGFDAADAYPKWSTIHPHWRSMKYVATVWRSLVDREVSVHTSIDDAVDTVCAGMIAARKFGRYDKFEERTSDYFDAIPDL